MTTQEKIAQIADVAGARSTLARIATWKARKASSADVSIFYDEMWIHRVGSDYIPISKTFVMRNYDESPLTAMMAHGEDFWFHLYQPHHGDTIIDVGAGEGMDTLLFSRAVGPGGKVLAIEAHPATFERLEKLCKWNHLDNVDACQCAIMDQAGFVYIEDNPVSEINTVAASPGENHLPTQIAAVSLDELCRERKIERVDFLKMNIEGAERLAVQGAREILSKTKYVCIACHDFMDESSEYYRTREPIIEFLQQHHFRISIRESDERPFVRHHVHAVNEKM